MASSARHLTRSVTKTFRRSLPREVVRFLPPRESRHLLRQMRVFAGCDRRQLARLARWGEIVEVAAGDMLVRENHTDFWFYVIVEGSAQVTHRGREVARLQRFDHFGELAIIGFRPQSATVTAAEPTVLFVLSRQHLLSLVSLEPSVQQALFPEVAPDAFREFRRKLQDQGRRSWDRLVPREQRTIEMKPGSDAVLREIRASRPRPSGRALTWDEAIHLLSRTQPEHLGGTTVAPSRATTRSRLIAIGIVAWFLVGFAFLFHPPFAVVTQSAPIDVVDDISITGMRLDKPTGRYLMTTVNVDRPSLAGTLFAWTRGRTLVRTKSPEHREVDIENERRLGREAFLRSHRLAISLAEKELGLDPTGLSIVIRDRGVTGPSAGLIYALAIVDMLDPDDLADGRVIAATGEMLSDARVGPVGFLRLKAAAAHDGGAVLFLVPSSQRAEVREEGLNVIGVANLEAAVRALHH